MDLEELVARVQSDVDDEASFTEICRRFNRLVMKYSKQHHLAGIFEDAAAEGWLAVVEAVRKYDPKKNVKFAGYVDSCIKYAIWNLFKRNRRRWQMEVPETVTIEGREFHVADLIAADNLDIASQISDKNELAGKIKKLESLLEKISDKQQAALKLTFIDEWKLREVAREMDITPQAVYNLQRRGINRMRREMAK